MASWAFKLAVYVLMLQAFNCSKIWYMYWTPKGTTQVRFHKLQNLVQKVFKFLWPLLHKGLNIWHIPRQGENVFKLLLYSMITINQKKINQRAIITNDTIVSWMASVANYMERPLNLLIKCTIQQVFQKLFLNTLLHRFYYAIVFPGKSRSILLTLGNCIFILICI